jgi:hypothetical protein
MRSWHSVFPMVAIETAAWAARSGDDTVIIFKAAPFG